MLAVAGRSGDAQRFYFGAVNGGVWRTDDAGRTWQPIFDSVNVGSIGAIAVAPSAPNIIYVGTGEADMRSDIAQGIGMFRSADGGKTLARASASPTRSRSARSSSIRAIPNVVFVAALGHPYGPNAERGVFRSTRWRRALDQDAATRTTNTGAIDLAFEPGNPQRRLRGDVADAPPAVEHLSAVERARAAGSTNPPTAAAPGAS